MNGTLIQDSSAGPGGPADETVLEFPDGIPGFGDAHHWELLQSEDMQPLLWLRCVERPALALLVVDPRILMPSYHPKIGPAHLARIGFEPRHTLLTLVVVAVQEDGRATVNLRAPVVVDIETMRGVQAILEDEDLPVRHPIGCVSPADEERTGRSEPCSSSAESPVSR